MQEKRWVIAWLSWTVTTLFTLFQFFLQTSAGLMAKEWQEDFHLTSTQLGSISAAFFISYVIMQIPVGIAYDRFGARRILITASIFLCLGIFAFSLSQVYWQAFLARLIMGVGSAFGFVGLLYVTSSWFPTKYFALLIGIAEMMTMLGIAAGEMVMAVVISNHGWRFTLFTAGWFAFAISLFILFFITDPKEQQPIKRQSWLQTAYSFKEVIKNREVWLAGIYGFASFAAVNVIATLWGVSFLINRYPSMSLNKAGLMISMVFIGIAIGGPINAWLVTKTQQRQWIMTIFITLEALALGCILFMPSLPFWSLYILWGAVGFFSSCYIQVFAVVKDSVPTTIVATALSTTNLILMSSAPLLQPLVGKLLELNFSFTKSLSIVWLILLLAALLSINLDKNKSTSR